MVSMPGTSTRLQMALEGEKECIMKRSKSVTSVFMDNMGKDRLVRTLFEVSYDVLLLASQPFPHTNRFSYIELKDMMGLPEEFNLYFRGMRVTPFRSEHNRSPVMRLGTFNIEDSGRKIGFYLQYLPPNSETIKHYHRMIHETYVSLVGDAWVGDKSLSDELLLQVPPGIGTFHNVRTGNKPALLLLCMEPDVGRDDYYYEESRRFNGKFAEVL